MQEEKGRRSQREEELEDQLDQLMTDISELAAGLVVAKDEKMKAEVALDDIQNREMGALGLVSDIIKSKTFNPPLPPPPPPIHPLPPHTYTLWSFTAA